MSACAGSAQRQRRHSFCCSNSFGPVTRKVETIPYSEFEASLDQGKVAEVTVSTDSIPGTLKEPLPSGKREFFAVRVDTQLAEKLASHQVAVKEDRWPALVLAPQASGFAGRGRNRASYVSSVQRAL
jgi:hypothetical protein